MRRYFFGITALFLWISFSCSSIKQDSAFLNDRNVPFDLGWKFIRDSVPGAEAISFNDSLWRNVDLPHDWSIENIGETDTDDQIGPFTKASEGGPATGHVKGGTGWYRKHFSVDPSDSSKHITLCFDGVYMIANVWVNGKKAGNHFYGYTPFSFDISAFLQPGSDNVVAVEVKNSGKNSRWYSGSGIYRHVWLTKTDRLRVDENGVFVRTSLPAKDTAKIQISVTVKNGTLANANTKIQTEITDKDGKVVSNAESNAGVKPGGSVTVDQSVKISAPALWSPETPVLYLATVRVVSNGSVIDSYPVQFGIRELKFNAGDGVTLNGSKVELKGACMHHDNGLLGSATFDRAEERRVEIMKANGYNAIRTSHNPPSRQFLEACDRLGMLVIDEAFDMWEKPKNPMDYSLYFKEHWKGDLESMILRDRNHPSVIIWSIGNEINERADTSGQRIAKNLSETVKALDNTRPITAAICMFWDHPGMDWTSSPPAFAHLDIGGYNYQWGEYENDHKKFPERIMMGTESFPVEAFENWQHVEKDAWVIGDFVWTGMDYLGESGIGHVYLDKKDATFSMLWPWYNSWCGDIDICGQKKAQSYYRDVVWKRSMLEMAVHSPVPEGKKEGVSLWGWPSEYQSWTWPGAEGKPLQVSVYSRCTSVRLELNGKVIGEKKITTDPVIQPRSFAEMMSGSGSKLQLTATFDVPYASGELKAIGIVDGKEVATKILTSAGKPASIRLTPDRGTIRANRNDLGYVTIEITDGSGNLIPNAEVPVQISVTGDGELQASGNAAPNDMKSFRKAKCVTFQGRCLAIVRPFTREGSINVSASAEGLPAQSIAIKTNQSGK